MYPDSARRVGGNDAMQKTISILLGAVLALALAGCGGDAEAEESSTPAEAVAELATIKTMLDTALGQYRRGNVKAAERTVGDAYLEHFEHVEEPLGDRDHERMEELEEYLSTEIRDLMKDRAPAADVARLIRRVKLDLDRAAATLRE